MYIENQVSPWTPTGHFYLILTYVTLTLDWQKLMDGHIRQNQYERHIWETHTTPAVTENYTEDVFIKRMHIYNTTHASSKDSKRLFKHMNIVTLISS